MVKRRNANDLEDALARASQLGILGGKTPSKSESPQTETSSGEKYPEPSAVSAQLPEPVSASATTLATPSVALTKCTFYLSDEDILALDEMQSDEFRRTRKRTDRSHLVRQAIQHYYKSRQER